MAERSDFARRLTQPLLPTGCTHHIWPNLLNLDLSALVCFVTESRREELAGFRWMSLLLTFLHLIKWTFSGVPWLPSAAIMQNMIFDSVFEVDSVLENESDFFDSC